MTLFLLEGVWKGLHLIFSCFFICPWTSNMPHSKDAHLPFGVGGRAGGRTHHVASRVPLPATCLTPAILGHLGRDICQPTAAGQGSLTPVDIAHLIQGVWEPDGDSTRRFRLSKAHPGISGNLREK